MTQTMATPPTNTRTMAAPQTNTQNQQLPANETNNNADVVESAIIFKTGSHRYHRGTHNGRRVIFKYCTHEPWTEFEEAAIETLESMDRNRKSTLDGITRLSNQVGRIDTLTVDSLSNLVNINNDLHELVNLQTQANGNNENLLILMTDLVSKIEDLTKTIKTLKESVPAKGSDTQEKQEVVTASAFVQEKIVATPGHQ